MNALSIITSVIPHSLAWALIHSLWQGLIIYVALYLILNIFPDISARIKYYLSFGALTAMVLWFANTWITEYQQLKGFIVYISGTTTELAVTNTHSVKTLAAAQHSSVAGSMLPTLERYFPILIVAYAIGLSFMLSRFLISLLQVQRLKTMGTIPLAPQYYNLLTDCKNRLGIARNIQLYLSNRVSTPMMLGAIKPIILLPLATINHLTIEQMEAIIMHELAHIKRHDYLLNIFQTVAETILFFNPCIWLISAIIRREREHCCDDLVLTGTNNPLPYAKALAILEGSRLNNNALALGATGHKNLLLTRIKRIMEMKKQNINRSQLAIIIAIIITITFSIAMFTFTPSFAQKSKKQEQEKAAPATKTVYKSRTVTIDSNGKKTVIEKVSDKPIEEVTTRTPGVKVTIMDDTAGMGGKKVCTKIIVDKSGKQKVIRTVLSPTGEVETENISEEDAFADIRKMAEDIKQMTKNLNEAEIDLNAVDWDELKENLDEKLTELTHAAKIKLDIDISKELEAGKKAIREAEIEIEKAGKHHVLVEKRIRKQADADRIQAEKDMEQSRKDLEQSKRDLEQSKRDIAQGEKNIEQGKKNIAQGKKNIELAKKITDECEPMLQQMEQEGLINRSGNYKIVNDGDVLYINEQKQPAATYEKYKKYLKGKIIVMKESNTDKIIKIN